MKPFPYNQPWLSDAEREQRAFVRVAGLMNDRVDVADSVISDLINIRDGMRADLIPAAFRQRR